VSAPATALAATAASCHDCGMLVALAHGGHGLHCPRCGAAVHSRKRNSVQRTWALVMAAAICYVPANLLPVMRVTSLGKTESDTIMSGVLYFLLHGDWPLAVVIFTASVFVPLVRLGNLATIEAGAGAVFFGAVVVITILAAESFDPRLIWDASEAGEP